MMRGDVMGHEFMGEVVELGASVTNLKSATAWLCLSPSRAAVASFARKRYGACATIPTRTLAWPKKFTAILPPDCLDTHLLGGYAGGQAEYARVPFADVGPIIKTR